MYFIVICVTFSIVLLFQFQCNVSLLNSVFYANDFKKLCKNILKTTRSLEALGENQTKKINHIVKSLEIVCVVFILLSLVEVYFFVPLSGASEDMYFAIWFFKNYCGSLQKVLIPLYYLSFVALFLGSVEQFFGLYWVCFQIIFQIINLSHFVSNVTSNITNNEEVLYDDYEYQSEITKRLKFCIKYHQEIHK